MAIEMNRQDTSVAAIASPPPMALENGQVQPVAGASPAASPPQVGSVVGPTSTCSTVPVLPQEQLVMQQGTAYRLTKAEIWSNNNFAYNSTGTRVGGCMIRDNTISTLYRDAYVSDYEDPDVKDSDIVYSVTIDLRHIGRHSNVKALSVFDKLWFGQPDVYTPKLCCDDNQYPQDVETATVCDEQDNGVQGCQQVEFAQMETCIPTCQYFDISDETATVCDELDIGFQLSLIHI